MPKKKNTGWAVIVSAKLNECPIEAFVVSGEGIEFGRGEVRSAVTLFAVVSGFPSGWQAGWQ